MVVCRRARAGFASTACGHGTAAQPVEEGVLAMRKRFGSSLTAAVAVGIAFAAPASAATLANWQMNEGSGASVMVDSSGHVNGTIGSAVVTGFRFGGATAYHWAFTSPTAPPAKPERIVQASSSTLNPNSGNYTVAAPLPDDQALREHRPEGPGRVVGRLLQDREPERQPHVRLPGHELVRQVPATAGRLADRPQRRRVARRPLRADGDRPDADHRRLRRRDGARQLGEHHEQPPDLDRRQAELRPDPHDLRLLHGRHRLHHDLELAIGMGGRPPAGAGGLRRSRSGKLAAFAPRERRAL